MFDANAALSLVNIARERDGARSRYANYKSVEEANKFLLLNDNSLFQPIWDAYQALENASATIAKESEAFFNSMPDGLKFAVKDLAKPLVLAEAKSIWQTSSGAYCLMVKLKPIDPKVVFLGKPVDPEYIYDVEIIDVTKL